MPTIITAPGDLKYHRLDRDIAFIERCAVGGQFADDTRSSPAVTSPAAWSGSAIAVRTAIESIATVMLLAALGIVLVSASTALPMLMSMGPVTPLAAIVQTSGQLTIRRQIAAITGSVAVGWGVPRVRPSPQQRQLARGDAAGGHRDRLAVGVPVLADAGGHRERRRPVGHGDHLLAHGSRRHA